MEAKSSRSHGSAQGSSYDVFLSYRGTDIRTEFSDHLYRALLQEGIRAFIDAEGLVKGEEITLSLEKAIKESRIAIILISENYASSRWCLDELAAIMDRRKRGELIVKPIFYRVDPREVRMPREMFARALAAHEVKLGNDSDRVKRWREALFEVGNISGWNLDAKGDEAELIRHIVGDINASLGVMPLYVTEFPVGIEPRAERIKDLLKLGSGNVLRLGLWGMGGIGKTTIAKAVFNDISHQFDGCAFLPSIRDSSANPSIQLAVLQQRLLSEVLRQRGVMVSCIADGVDAIRHRLCSKKVLVILDDVSETDQLDALAGGLDWFGDGSRIIITTRDKSLLTKYEDCIIHEIKGLHKDEAIQLFSQHAFGKNIRQSIRQDLIDSYLHYAQGLPLAVQVMGSFLRDKPEYHWINMMKSLAKDSSKDIDNLLRLSLEELPDNVKEIFLDIACFFLGKARSYIEKVLDAYRFQTSFGIEILIERCLITTTKERQTVEMHDLVQLMGQNIVREKYPGDPRRCSRLWIYEDALQLLSSKEEDLYECTDFVQGIVVRLPNPKDMHINVNVLSKLKKLRLLIMENVSHLGDPICFPSSLCWIEWTGYSASSLEFSHVPENLAGLDMPKSCIKTLGRNFRDLENLTHVNFSGCKWLTEIPDFSMSSNMKTLDISMCTRLDAIADSVGYLDKLVYLSLYGCSNLVKLPRKQHWRDLRAFLLIGCPKLENFPEVMHRMEFLEKLSLSGSGIKELPASIENLVCVKQINLRFCRNLVTIPGSIYNLQRLELLMLDGCSSLKRFPAYTGESTGLDGVSVGCPNLQTLCLSRCNLSEVEFLGNFNCFPLLATLFLSENYSIAAIPPLGRLKNLKELHLSKCRRLQAIPELPLNLSVVKANGCTSLQRIEALSSRISSFREVDLSSCPEMVRQGTSMESVLPLEEARKLRDASFLLTGGVMPDWLEQSHFPNSVPSGLQAKMSTVFLVPANAHGILAGILLCIALGPRDGLKTSIAFQIEISVNGTTATISNSFFQEVESEVMWLKYHSGDKLKFRQLIKKDVNLFEVSLGSLSGGYIKCCGFRLVWEDKEDELQIFQLQRQMENEHEDQNGSHRDLESKKYPILLKRIVHPRKDMMMTDANHINTTSRVGLQLLLG